MSSSVRSTPRTPAPSDASRRGWAMLVSRLTGQLGLRGPDQALAPVVDGKSARGRRAAESRWRR
jgi:hypothetical protein